MSDDLPQELLRLERRLTSPRIRDELSTIRDGLAAPSPAPRLQLANLRIATPCKERWADMVGDDRVRACNGCDRPVFNLSELTRDEAEALLATRGLTPCVRFYRRTDGTVMTADCPTGTPRPRRRLPVVAGTLALAGSSPALADPPVEAPPEVIEIHDTVDVPLMGIAIESQEVIDTAEVGIIVLDSQQLGQVSVHAQDHSVLESSLTVRLGYGIASHKTTAIARSTRPPLMPDSASLWEGAVTGDLTAPIALDGDLRLGAWGELRTSSDPVAGGELIVKAIGPGIIALRVGGNTKIATGALAIGHMVGLRIVAAANRSLDESHDWSATLGIEVDPLRAIGYILNLDP